MSFKAKVILLERILCIFVDRELDPSLKRIYSIYIILLFFSFLKCHKFQSSTNVDFWPRNWKCQGFATICCAIENTSQQRVHPSPYQIDPKSLESSLLNSPRPVDVWWGLEVFVWRYRYGIYIYMYIMLYHIIYIYLTFFNCIHNVWLTWKENDKSSGKL